MWVRGYPAGGHEFSFSGGKFVRGLTFEFETETRARSIGPQFSVFELRQPVKQHGLDPHVIVKVFEVHKRIDGAAHMGV